MAKGGFNCSKGRRGHPVREEAASKIAKLRVGTTSKICVEQNTASTIHLSQGEDCYETVIIGVIKMGIDSQDRSQKTKAGSMRNGIRREDSPEFSGNVGKGPFHGL
jgi:hypothetical protein